MSDFLPEGYEPPKASGKYTKFEDGKTARLRIMSQPILGWVYWDKVTGDKSKPIRLPYNDLSHQFATEEARKNPKEDDRKVNHFWTMVVWNYDTKQMEVCEITQKTIQTAIRNQSADTEYGSPLLWDIKITKTKEKDKTSYVVSPGVPKPVAKEIQDEYNQGLINLQALFH